MPNQIMPDSDYDIGKRGYGSIWIRTKEFHATLKFKAELLAQDDPELQTQHVDHAIKVINKEISERIRKERPFVPLRDLAREFSGGLFGVFVTLALPAFINGEYLSILALFALIGGIILFLVGRQ